VQPGYAESITKIDIRAGLAFVADGERRFEIVTT
jgi:hypothetical protein